MQGKRLVLTLAAIAWLLPNIARAAEVELGSGQVRVTTGRNAQVHTGPHYQRVILPSRGVRYPTPSPTWRDYHHGRMSCSGGNYLSSQQVSSQGSRTVMVQQSSTCSRRDD